jgi:hypothetical protein
MVPTLKMEENPLKDVEKVGSISFAKLSAPLVNRLA